MSNTIDDLAFLKERLKDMLCNAVRLPAVVDSGYTHPYYTGLVTILIKAYGDRIEDHTFELDERKRTIELGESFVDLLPPGRSTTEMNNFDFSLYRDLVHLLQVPEFRTLYADDNDNEWYTNPTGKNENDEDITIQSATNVLLNTCNSYYDKITTTRRLGEHSSRAQLLKYSSRILSIFFLEEVPKRVSKTSTTTLGWAGIEPSSVLHDLDGKSFIHHEIDFFFEEATDADGLVNLLWTMLSEVLHADVNMLHVLNDVFKRMDGTVIILSDATSNPVRIKLSDSSDSSASSSSSGQTQWIVAVSVLGVVCVTLIILLVLSRQRSMR